MIYTNATPNNEIISNLNKPKHLHQQIIGAY